MLCNYAHSILKDKEVSKDIVQEVFANLWNKKNSLTLKSSIDSYLINAVKFKSIDFIRNKKVKNAYEKKIIEQSETHDEDAVIIEERKKKIMLAINSLPEKCRIIFLKSKLEGYTYSEISKDLNISVKTVENQISRAFKLIKNKIFKK